MRILAVDDDPILLDFLTKTLGNLGYSHVRTANSPAEALTILEAGKEQFDCFLLDIQMPGMSGIELCSAIRRLERHRHTPIMMLTSLSDRDYVDQSFQAGAIDYVNKPINELELKARIKQIERIVEARKASRESLAKLEESANGGRGTEKFALEESISIADVPNVVDFLVLENYLLQLTRSQSYFSTAIGFHISNFSLFHRQLPGRDLRDLLTDIAEVIARQFQFSNFLMTYMGGGSFALVTRRGRPEINEYLQDAIQSAIEELDLFEDYGLVGAPIVHLGDPQTDWLLFGTGPLGMVMAATDSARRKDRRNTHLPKLGHSKLTNLLARRKLEKQSF